MSTAKYTLKKSKTIVLSGFEPELKHYDVLFVTLSITGPLDYLNLKILFFGFRTLY